MKDKRKDEVIDTQAKMIMALDKRVVKLSKFITDSGLEVPLSGGVRRLGMPADTGFKPDPDSKIPVWVQIMAHE